jgi:hypothetical protein
MVQAESEKLKCARSMISKHVPFMMLKLCPKEKLSIVGMVTGLFEIFGMRTWGIEV